MPRTFVIGDIHGDSDALDALLARMPKRRPNDTLVFLGDYVDRGWDSAGVIARVRKLQSDGPGRVVCLRGNHEDKWIESYKAPDAPFLVQVANGCAATYRSFTGGPSLGEDETVAIDEYPRLLDVANWFPRETIDWMMSLELFYEDAHAVYVHAGLERDGDGGWKSPADSDPQSILWMRDPSFYKTYAGKRLVFGHNPVSELPVDDSTGGAWVHGSLVGLDTGSGKGGFLSALELPSMRLYESR